MLRFNRLVTFLALVALIFSACQPIARSTTVAPAKLDDATVTQIEDFVYATMSENHVPGFAIGIIKGGQVVYAKGFGVADMNSGRPMTTATLAAIASLSKQFTTAAVMQLVQQGKIKLDAKVTDYLPYFKLGDERYQKLTIRHLLSNTSGLTHPDFATAYDYTRRQTSPQALDDYVRSLANRKLEADPDARTFIYSNDNWDILADVIAKVTGQPFETYVTQNVIQPLGLKQTTFFLAQADHQQLMASHWLDKNGKLVSSPEPPDYDQVHTAPGGIVSNIDEMLIWAKLHLNQGEFQGKPIVPATAYATMWNPYTPMKWELGGLFQEWGMGWALACEQGHRVAWWGGIDLGSNAMLMLAPDDNVAVVTVTNATKETDWAPWYSYDIGYPVLQMVLGVKVQPPESEALARR